MIKGRLKTSKTRFQTTFDLSGYTISQYGSSSAVGDLSCQIQMQE